MQDEHMREEERSGRECPWMEEGSEQSIRLSFQPDWRTGGRPSEHLIATFADVPFARRRIGRLDKTPDRLFRARV